MMDIKDIVKPFGSQSFLIGIGVAALAYFLAPQLKQSLRPAAVKGAAGVMTLGDKTKKILEESKDKISNLIFDKTEEARDKVRDVVEEAGISPDVLKEMREEREVSNKMIQELKDSIVSLKEEISHIKKGANFQEG